jgi:hypothetical protein
MKLWGREPVEIPVGARFRRMQPNRVAELAEVVSVNDDRVGIPHVHYKVRFKRPEDDRPSVENRCLALSVFAEIYTERMPA